MTFQPKNVFLGRYHSFLGYDFLPYSESLSCGECYSVLQQHHLNWYLLRNVYL